MCTLICVYLSQAEREGPTTLGPRLGDGDSYGPVLPADFVVAAGDQPGLAALLLEKMDGDLATATTAAAATDAAAGGGGIAMTRGCGGGTAGGGDGGGCGGGSGGLRVWRLKLAGEGCGALLYHGFKLDVIDVREGEV